MEFVDGICVSMGLGGRNEGKGHDLDYFALVSYKSEHGCPNVKLTTHKETVVLDQQFSNCWSCGALQRHTNFHGTPLVH